MSRNEKHAVVVGAGIVGVCAGLELQRRGFKVTIADRGEPGAACSFGNAGILAAQACVPFALPGIHREVPGMLFDREGPLVVRREGLARTIPWVWRFLKSARGHDLETRADAMKALYGTTIELHEALAREAGVPELVAPTHYFYVYRRREDVDVETAVAWRLRRDRGARIEVLDGGAVQEAEPAVSTDFQRAVRLGPVGRTANPFRLTQSYARLFADRGGMLATTEVTRLVPDGATVTVETAQGPLAADLVVVAAGSWSLALLEPLGFTCPLVAERGYHVTFANPGLTLRNVISHPTRHFALSSMEMGLRVAGTEELGPPDAPPSWRRADVLARLARTVLPGLNVSEGSRWMGPRPGTPDSLPAIGPVPGHPNILVGFGHGHLGLTGAPATARIIAGLATGERSNMDLAAYRPDRFR